MTKKCTKCGESREFSEFHKRTAGALGLDSWCKGCKRVYRRQYFLANKENEVVRSRQKAWKYQGIALEYSDYLKECLMRQNKCDICTKEIKVMHVDHNHQTGKIRGFLCGSCNKGLGLFQDSPHLCKKASAYLETTL